MKTLQNYIKESILDDIDTQIKTGNKAIKDEIKAFLKENYNGTFEISKKPNSDGLYEVSSTKNIEVKNNNITSLTNGMFIWTTINGSFNCSYCSYLESLEGAPKEVFGIFYCNTCSYLESLKGAPEKVGGDFYCSSCKSLKNLKGAPKEVGKSFYCYSCSSLESLEGAPKEVGGTFVCRRCKIKFTEEDVKKVSNVKGKINC